MRIEAEVGVLGDRVVDQGPVEAAAVGVADDVGQDAGGEPAVVLALGPGVMPIVYWRLSLASVIASALRLVQRRRLLPRRVHVRPVAQYFSASRTISSKSSRPVADSTMLPGP